MTPAPDGVGAWAERLRAAAYDAVSAGDVTAIMGKQVERAKAGDQKAAKFVLDFLTGGAPKVQVQQVLVSRRSESTSRHTSGAAPAAGNAHGVRVRVARVLGAVGPLAPGKLAEATGLAADRVEAAVTGCAWFEADKLGAVRLTNTGRREALGAA